VKVESHEITINRLVGVNTFPLPHQTVVALDIASLQQRDERFLGEVVIPACCRYAGENTLAAPTPGRALPALPLFCG
jgi:hypothetical protein